MVVFREEWLPNVSITGGLTGTQTVNRRTQWRLTIRQSDIRGQ